MTAFTRFTDTQTLPAARLNELQVSFEQRALNVRDPLSGAATSAIGVHLDNWQEIQ